MKISELKARQGNVDVVGEITEKGEAKEFNKFGKPGRVCNAKLKDASGEIKLTLWNDQVDQFQAGDKVHLVNGYVGEWQGELQLSTGKFGEITKEGEESKTPSKKMKTDEGSHVLTEDEKEEEEVLDEEGMKKPTPIEESETEDEVVEEEVDVEEETID
jgi:replication factor A1